MSSRPDRIGRWVHLEIACQVEGADVEEEQRALGLNGNEGRTAMKRVRELVAAARQAVAETKSAAIVGDSFDEFDEAGNPSVALLEAIAEAEIDAAEADEVYGGVGEIR